jgi:hypothetical protein
MSIVIVRLHRAAAIHDIFMPTLSAGAESHAATEATNTVTTG